MTGCDCRWHQFILLHIIFQTAHTLPAAVQFTMSHVLVRFSWRRYACGRFCSPGQRQTSDPPTRTVESLFRKTMKPKYMPFIQMVQNRNSLLQLQRNPQRWMSVSKMGFYIHETPLALLRIQCLHWLICKNLPFQKNKHLKSAFFIDRTVFLCAFRCVL